MPAALYLKPHPRALYVVTESHALVFRQPESSESKSSKGVVVTEYVPMSDVDARGLIKLGRSRAIEGVMGLISVPTDRSPVPEVFLLCITSSSPVSAFLPNSPHHPSKILYVEFHSLSNSLWDPLSVTEASSGYNSPYAFEPDIDDPYGLGGSYTTSPASAGTATTSLTAQQGGEHPCNGMKKYLESGGFFYAEGGKWDITKRASEGGLEGGKGKSPLDSYDERFLWNATPLAPLLSFRKRLPADLRAELDSQNLLIPVMQGFCGATSIASSGTRSSLGLISRLGWKRAGARFRTRGVDDDGQVANFVETETIMANDDVFMSYVQVRGSVPLFWEQQGNQTFAQKVQITRPPVASQMAFDKHFTELVHQYHSVHAINLLGQKDNEVLLSNAYTSHLESLSKAMDHSQGDISLTAYDFHAVVKVGGHEAVRADFSKRLREISQRREQFGWTTIDRRTGEIVERQKGVFRTNCLDCLDRTNYVQDILSTLAVTSFLYSLQSPLLSQSSIWSAHRELWADNGDRLSKIYTGTGALNTSSTRTGKRTFGGLLSDATKSVSRAYFNNFEDSNKQASVDMLLGLLAGQRPVLLFDPINDTVQAAVEARASEYSEAKNITIFAGTWNLNGRPPGEPLHAWLFPPGAPDADIYAISFQEIVQLTAQQILQTDPEKKRMWEAFILDTFAKRGKGSPYVLLRSEQLVGTALIILIKEELAGRVRGVEGANVKTGLRGVTGNKGGVAVRLELFETPICIVSCHLAAGQLAVAERRNDYRTISQDLRFTRGKQIDDHEIIIWAADFNYRIELDNAECRELAMLDCYDELFVADQLRIAMEGGDVFVGYNEGPINFRPTYKYDNNSDDYDTSEKARVPAWTDRILFRGSALRLREYQRAELKASDHRPVYAVFDATVRQVDYVKRSVLESKLSQEVNLAGAGDSVDRRIEQSVSANGIKSVPKDLLGSEELHTQYDQPWHSLPNGAPEAVHRAANLVRALDTSNAVLPITSSTSPNPFDWESLDSDNLRDFNVPRKGAFVDGEKVTYARRKPPPPPLAPKPQT